MPISFSQKTSVFHLRNAHFSYCFFINEAGMLQHLYFGSPITEIPLKKWVDLGWDWAKTYFDHESHEEKQFKNGLYLSHSLFEVPSFGYSDKRGGLVQASAEGDTKADFRFVSYRIYQGKPSLGVLPSFRDNDQEAETLEICLKDVTKDLYLTLSYSLFPNASILFRNSALTWKGPSLFTLRKINSLSLDLPSSEWTLTHFSGDWSFERQIVREELKEGTKRLQASSGRSSHEENPFFFLSSKDATETQGEIYGFSWVYSGGFIADINVSKWNTTRVTLGNHDEEFAWTLASGETYQAPEALLAYSSQGFEMMTHQLHDIIRQHLILIPEADIKESIVLNSWEGCYFDFDTAKMIDFIRSAKRLGATLFVLDDGWFQGRNEDSTSLGDWKVDTRKLDLAKIIEVCHEEGLKFGLWFEPEMINPQSRLFQEHPEYATGNPKIDRSLSRHQLPLDLCNPQAVEQVFQQVSDILDTYAIDYVKWDHNRGIDDAYSSYLAPERQGEFYPRMVLGYYELAKRLTERYPQILFHGCASGGGRFDLGSLYYFPEIWTSDENDPVQRLLIQFGTSMMYPLVSMGAHVSKAPTTGYDTKAQIALFGTYGFELDPRTVNSEDQERLKTYNALFHKYHKDVICEGDFYRLSSPFESNEGSMMAVNKNKTKALVLFMNLMKENRHYRFLKLRGLDPMKHYWNSFDHEIYTGETYQKIGLNLTGWRDAFASSFIVLEETPKDSFPKIAE